MFLEQLKKRAQEKINKKPLPDWVSEKNLTIEAYQLINQLKAERLLYIQKHNKVSDFETKKVYQISANKIANSLGVATTTLISTSKYSPSLKAFLNEVNRELEDSKNKKLETHKRTLTAGIRKRKKDELVLELQKARIELDQLKIRNAEEQVKQVFANLPLPLKRKLGINV